MQRWEYQTLSDVGFDPQTRKLLYRIADTLNDAPKEGMSMTDILNESGRDGWEVVAAYSDDDAVTYLLKRPLA